MEPQAASFDSILAQCRDLVCDRLSQALAGMFDKADEALSALVNESRDEATQTLYRKTRDKVLAERETFEKQFRARYQAEFQKRSNRVKKIGDSFSEIDLASVELELVGDADLNETLKFNEIAARLREYCEEELTALDQRVGVLLGDASLQMEDNPFTPVAICDTYKQTCLQFDENVDVRMVLLKLFDDHVLDDIRAVYKAVNALLVQNSILPKIRRVSSKRKETPAPSTSDPDTVANVAERVAAGEQDFFAVLQNMFTSNFQQMAHAGATGVAGLPWQGPTGEQACPRRDPLPCRDFHSFLAHPLREAWTAADPGSCYRVPSCWAR